MTTTNTQRTQRDNAAQHAMAAQGTNGYSLFLDVEPTTTTVRVRNTTTGKVHANVKLDRGQAAFLGTFLVDTTGPVPDRRAIALGNLSNAVAACLEAYQEHSESSDSECALDDLLTAAQRLLHAHGTNPAAPAAGTGN